MMHTLFRWFLSSTTKYLATCTAVTMLLAIGSAYAQAPTDKVVAHGETVRIQIYPGTIGSGHPVLWVMVAKGFCQAHGIKCQLVVLPSGPLGLQALASGSIEISYATTDVAMQAAAHGADIQLIASTHPGNYFTLDVRKDIPLPDLSKGYPAVMHDLKGLKIGVTGRGAGTEIQTHALLLGAGMSLKDVTFVAVGSPGTSYPALLAHRIDAAMMYEPFNTLCQMQSTCVAAVDLRKGEGPPDLTALNGAVQEFSATRRYIKTHPIVINAFIQAVQDSVKWIRNPANLDDLVKISKKYFSLGDIPNADAALRKLLRGQQETVGATLDRRAVKAFADYLLKYELIKKPFDTSDFVYKYAPRP